MSRVHADAALLSALAAGLCQDAGVAIEVHPGPWQWDPLRRVIRVSAHDLETHGPDYCAGVLANEVGHFFITRQHLFKHGFPDAELPSPIGSEILLDALEDPRVDQWIAERYPGVERWHAAAYGEPAPINLGLPDFLIYCMACAQEERAFLGVSAAVADALTETWEARHEYADVVPSVEAVAFGSKGLRARYQFQVWPALITPRWVPAPHEQAVQISAVEALRLAQAEIFPAAARLYHGDVEAIERYLNDRPERAARARRMIKAGQARELMVQVRHHPGRSELTSRWAHDLAREALEAMLIEDRPRRLIRATGPGLPGDPSTMPPPPPDLPPLQLEWQPPSNYDRAHARVAEQIERLTRHLDEVLRPRKRLNERSGYPSGRHVDLRKLMQFEADPRRYSELWVRSTIPDRRDVAMTLLVDLSGSMSGDKIESALLGTILLAETLDRLSVSFAVIGFQDVLVPLRRFDQPFDEAARQAIAEMPQEVGACRHGGNNMPSYNDDGPCVLEAAEDLLNQSATERVLIVVSDGLPEGRRSNKDDLRRAIETITGPATGLELIGLGLGPGTQHVRTYYPESVANVAVARFSDEIARLVERVVLGPTR
jgi:uncharacterized protein with von Willebrand factor type A (vWA) domain